MNTRLALVLCAVGSGVLSFSCARTAEPAPAASTHVPVTTAGALSVTPPSSTDRWYQFSRTDGRVHLRACPAPSHPSAPEHFVPWTEAVRLSAVDAQQELLLINRAGVLPATQLARMQAAPVPRKAPSTPAAETTSLTLTPPALLATQSAEGFYSEPIPSSSPHPCQGTGAVFVRLYTDPLFTTSPQDSAAPFLVRYDVRTARWTSVAYTRALGLPRNAQCTALTHTRGTWYASFKSSEAERVSFAHFSFPSLSSLENLEPTQRREHPIGRKVQVPRPISAAAFRAACTPQRLHLPTASTSSDHHSDLHELLVHRLLARVPLSPLYLSARSPCWASDRSFLKTAHRTADERAHHANALIFHPPRARLSAALLTDSGHLYFVREDGSEGHARLSALPPQFVYTSFTLSGPSLIAGWEEQDFFQVGSTGLLCTEVESLTGT